MARLGDVRALVERAFRDDQGRAVAAVARAFGDLDLAVEAVQEAFVLALRTWEREVPTNLGAWITTAARNRAIDQLRREGRLAQKTAALAAELERVERAAPDDGHGSAIADDRLRLLFTCCHPALAPEAQVALTLRLVAGLSTAQVARAFLVAEPAMAQRLVRAKRKIRGAAIPFRVPPDEQLAERIDVVCAAIYLVFNAGYVRSEGDGLVDVELCGEAIRLARLLDRLLPANPEVEGLVALLLLIDARRAARVDAAGALVRLEEQDRSLWNQAAITEGLAILDRALRRPDRTTGRYQVQAAIAALHDEAATFADTDWQQIAALYERLLAMEPSPVVALNHAVAVAYAQSPDAALALLAPLAGDLEGYQPFHAARAELLAQVGARTAAADAYQRALALTSNTAERSFLEGRLAAL